jgi:hypothetical protein
MSFDEQMDTFFEVEERVLRAAGLDQAAVSTIMQYLQSRRSAIAKNLSGRRMIYTQRLEKVVDDTIDGVARLLAAKETRGIVKTRQLRRTKEKVVGLATIWADAVPLAIAGDWGASSVWSCVAGATVAVIMPGS